MKLRLGIFASLGLAAFLLAGTGCATNKTTAERESLLNQNKDLEQQLDAEKKARSDAESRASAAAQMTPAPAESTTPPSMAPNDLDLSSGLANGGRPPAGGARGGRASTPSLGLSDNISSSMNGAGEVVLEIPGDVLFDSGKATIKTSAQKSLDSIASAIKKQYGGQVLRIEGHTDASPVKNTGWDDNYDLGAARANAVLHYLAKKGISEKNMYIASFAANNPKSTKNQALNRRVDIVVVRNAR